MKHLKKYDAFLETAPATKPAPSTKPATPATEPGTKPERRERPTPIRRDRPAVEPDPQAKKKELKKANVEDVVENFQAIARKEGFNYKKYFKK
jgi:hypothetical protein